MYVGCGALPLAPRGGGDSVQDAAAAARAGVAVSPAGRRLGLLLPGRRPLRREPLCPSWRSVKGLTPRASSATSLTPSRCALPSPPPPPPSGRSSGAGRQAGRLRSRLCLFGFLRVYRACTFRNPHGHCLARFRCFGRDRSLLVVEHPHRDWFVPSHHFGAQAAFPSWFVHSPMVGGGRFFSPAALPAWSWSRSFFSSAVSPSFGGSRSLLQCSLAAFRIICSLGAVSSTAFTSSSRNPNRSVRHPVVPIFRAVGFSRLPSVSSIAGRDIVLANDAQILILC